MKISKEARRTARQLIRLTLRDGAVNEDTARQIVGKLIAEKPRHYLGILSAYQRMLRLEVEKRLAIVESAVELDGNERRSITSKLKKQHGADITTEFRVTPDLIGGLRIKLGSTVWDGSIKSRLDNFRNALAA
jgi:F-type H+-transporting ATPase subunit delta